MTKQCSHCKCVLNKAEGDKGTCPACGNNVNFLVMEDNPGTCKGVTGEGESYARMVDGDSEYCWQHASQASPTPE